MTREAFLSHLVFALGLFVLSCGICLLLIKRVRIMDVPNERSSHETPTPTSGGIVLVITFVIGVTAIYLFGDATLIKKKYFFGFLISSLFIAAISLYDDIRFKPVGFKLLSQIAAISIVMISGIVIREVTFPPMGRFQLGMIGYGLTFFGILGLTNAYNFMDGMSGMAAGTTVIAAAFFGYISYQEGSTFVYIVCYTLISGALGFLVFNFPTSRLFMGDVGSAFLGFVFANLSIIAGLYDHSHTSFLVVPLLLFHFIYDTAFTFVRRLVRGENVFQAHRTHLYQLFNRLGHSHMVVSGFHFFVGVAQGLGACYLTTIEGNRRMLVFVPYLVFQSIYAAIIIKKSKQKGIL